MASLIDNNGDVLNYDNNNDDGGSKNDSEAHTIGSHDYIKNIENISIEIDELLLSGFNNNLNRNILAKVIDQELTSLFSSESILNLVRINDKPHFVDIQSFDDSQDASSIDAGSFNLKLGKTDSAWIGREVSQSLFKALMALTKR